MRVIPGAREEGHPRQVHTPFQPASIGSPAQSQVTYPEPVGPRERQGWAYRVTLRAPHTRPHASHISCIKTKAESTVGRCRHVERVSEQVASILGKAPVTLPELLVSLGNTEKQSYNTESTILKYKLKGKK